MHACMCASVHACTCAVFPLLYDERGGLPCCFSKPPHSKYPKIATSELFLAINMFTCYFMYLSPLISQRIGQTPFRMHHSEGGFENISGWPCHIILLRGTLYVCACACVYVLVRMHVHVCVLTYDIADDTTAGDPEDQGEDEDRAHDVGPHELY